jgi:DNA-binding transcriptional MerR regulator
MPAEMTIGELASQSGLRTSALRYYEKRGLLEPHGRSPAGYRLYTSDALERLRFIQRAQRIGFSLADIRALLQGWDSGALSYELILRTAEARYLDLERRLTPLLIKQHELELALHDLRGRDPVPEGEERGELFDRLVEQVCANPLAQSAEPTLDRLLEHVGCRLTSSEGQDLLNRLRGQHAHIWQEGDDYHILVVSDDAQVLQALQALAEMEAGCEAHTEPKVYAEFSPQDEGYLLIARGENAFFFARLFLALQREPRVRR